ncbi:sensor histidine kinase [Paenibacillus aceris]|uniref:histidine kinase n=1 Tax=Paenibacillus aceris TaxID=869555 RepID=A0ABS4I690_9BACL|nr:sensor histidine kinase [Paenibacillus aceris]MBP1966360.1 signal transduction histidine kinase/methyl-accepting chemotaxis protein [Paenibacillus aceris]NHW38618.1 PAS domain-containing protein [Paenibacillus aceris]
MKHYSMRSHLTVTFAIMAMIPILILGSFQVSQITHITQESNRNQQMTTYRLGDAVQDYMYYHRNAVETLAATITASDAAFRTRESLRLKLQSLQQNLAGFTGIYVVDQNGLIKATHTTANDSLIGTDVKDRDYTKRVQAASNTIISSLFRGQEGQNQPAVAIAVPIYKANKQRDGFVLAVLELAPIKELVTKYDYGKEAYPVVLDHAGKPIYHPNGTLTETLTDLSKEPVVVDARTQRQGEGTYTLSHSAQKELITYKAIPEIDWIVWVSKSKAAVNAAFTESLSITILLLVMTLILTVLLGSFLAKRLNGTIHALVGYTQRLAGGTFVEPGSKVVPKGAPLELQLLADHFFTMAEQIKENQGALLQLNSELEDRVEERTQRLQDEHATLNAVLESMSDAVVLIDMDHHVVYANHRMAEIFAIPMSELAIMQESALFDHIALLLPERQDELEKLTAGPRVQGAFTVKNGQGKERFMMVSAFQVAREGRVFGRGYVWRDMTKEHEIDALKNDLISLASHEFKTPITSIRGSVETLLRVDAQWEESFKQELLEGIHEDIGRIQDLIDDWLDISKIDSGAMRINPQPLRVEAVVESAMRRLPQQANDAHTQFEVHVAEDTPLIYADKLRMEQVLVNLFTNAVRYNTQHPVIRITAHADERYVKLDVQDNGIGIAAEHVDKLFDRFYRVDVSSSRQTGGTGLGLAICKGIMQAHGGEVHVESKLGEGSTFTLSIPRFLGEGNSNEQEKNHDRR